MKIVINKRTPAHWAPVRAERDRLLAVTDAYMAADRLADDQAETLAQYRRALRDLPQDAVAATDVVWPAPPPFIRELQSATEGR